MSKNDGYLKGAIILSLGGIIVKILGAIYKIPLSIILKPEGMATFSATYSIYALLFVLSTSGVPVAVSKLVAESKHDKHVIFKVALCIFAAIGAIGSLILLLFAPQFANLIGNPYCKDGIFFVAPSVLFVSIASVYRGYNQGQNNMMPTAVSEVIETAGKLIVGLSLAYLFILSGQSVHKAGAVALFGVTAGAFFSLIYLYIVSEKNKTPMRQRLSIGKKLIRISIPVTITSAIISITNLIDTSLVLRLLQRGGDVLDIALWKFGIYNYAVNVFNLPSIFIATIAISTVPAISSCFASGDIEKTQKLILSSLKITLLLGIGAFCFLFCGASSVMRILYGSSDGSNLLRILSGSILFLSFATVSSSILHALGRSKKSVISITIGCILKIVLNYILIKKIGIEGAGYSTLISYLVIAVCNFSFILKEYKSFAKVLKTPVLILFSYFPVNFLIFYFTNLLIYGKINDIINIALSSVAFLILIFALKCFDDFDRNMLFLKKKR